MTNDGRIARFCPSSVFRLLPRCFQLLAHGGELGRDATVDNVVANANDDAANNLRVYPVIEIECGSKLALELGLEHGALVDLPNASGVTPFMAAAGIGTRTAGGVLGPGPPENVVALSLETGAGAPIADAIAVIGSVAVLAHLALVWRDGSNPLHRFGLTAEHVAAMVAVALVTLAVARRETARRARRA